MNRLTWPGLAVCAAMLAAGCGRSSAPPGTEPPAERLLRVLNWEDYIDPALVEQFTERTGIPVDYQTFATQDELVGLIRSDPGRSDLVIVDESVIQTLIDLQLLRTMDASRLAGLRHLDPPGTTLPPDINPDYAAPYHFGCTLLAYRKDQAPEPPAAWEALWDERYRGRIMMPVDFQEVFAVTLLSLGHPMNSGDPRELEEARERILRQAPLVLEYTDATTIQEALNSGEAALGVLYNGDAARIAATNSQIGIVLPPEGVPLWVDCFCFPRDARNVEAALAFMDFLMEPDIAAQNAAFLHYATPNRAARALMSPALLEDPAVFPPAAIRARSSYYLKPDVARLRMYNSTAAEVRRLRGALGLGPGTADP
ncbi:MAG TPA: spermidine/putrescine ABC transporter substrate-binding protein [Kiritimatiellia bacterium]|nr:spermidine/putrescine ABC transporter substrate-binding protein [Kiritimatiellia bacterium]HRZ10823.1 spermidine/putrescine ABC transporter substrate-binding protein [Kiritimatiellia bacterium]HSA18904.1 spermidine/putrescine ABC transporter substrate-binding protein [Kiritimatiellia bacterium]